MAEEAGCGCDECARKALLLPALRLAGVPLAEQLQQELQRHAKRAALGRQMTGGLQRGPGSRSWLPYDPDVFLPKHFDAFLLSGVCPPLQWPEATPDKEVQVCYVIGCGRSGSTILSEILSHYSLVFLNEPRQLWLPHLPLDVWSAKSDGQLTPQVSDLEHLAAAMKSNYRRAAALLAPGAQEPVLILEKFPEHAFRVDLLRELGRGLGARFLHLVRQGLPVARSISCFGQAAWYGMRDEKWCLVAESSVAHFMEL
ncbi:unnamed protein product [Effrenium voratum]|nr:unnamed protein product [Effrenium voratum]